MIISFTKLREYILQNSDFARENTIDIVIYNLMEQLERLNFDLSNLHIESGETSINFIKDDIVLRLTYVRYKGYDSITDYVSHSNAILPPLYEKKISTGDINYPTLLVLKRLEVGNVSDQEKESVYIKLREDGYLFNDASKNENFGKDENGNTYLIDYGELIYIKDKEKLNSEDLFEKVQYQKFTNRELKYHEKCCEKLNDIYLRYLSLKNKEVSEDSFSGTKKM